MRLFNRTYRLNLNGLLLTNLHIEFDIKHTDKKESNSSNIQIYNLSESSRVELANADNPFVQLDVGYDGDNATIFRGSVRRVTNRRDSTEWITDIDAGDGERQIARSYANISFPPGSSITDVITRLVDYTGLNIGNLINTIDNNAVAAVLTEYERGVTFSGNAHSIISKIGRTLGFRITVQDETYVATTLRGTLPGTGYVLSNTSGMIGSPDIGEDGTITVLNALIPSVRPQQRVELRSTQLNGFYRVRNAMHQGSFRGSQWTTLLELARL